MRSKLHFVIPGLLGALLFVGCGDSVTGDAVIDAPPETSVTSTPPVLSETDYTVTFFWTGFDPDGSIRGYQWRISDNGPDGVVDAQDTLTALLPWRYTAANDSVFSVSADLDSFEVDVRDPNQSPRTYRYWRTHTFFIRSVDEEGGRDPSPATVSFTADGWRSHDLAGKLAEFKLGVGVGHFYAYRLVEALGIDTNDGVVRTSFVHYTSEEEVTRLAQALDSVL